METCNTEEPYEGNPHVRICGGVGRVIADSTRKPKSRSRATLEWTIHSRDSVIADVSQPNSYHATYTPMTDTNLYESQTIPDRSLSPSRVSPNRLSHLASAVLAVTGGIALARVATSLVRQDLSVFNPAFQSLGPLVGVLGVAVFAVHAVAGLHSRNHGIHAVGALAIITTCVLVFDTPTSPLICPWALAALGILVFERWRASAAGTAAQAEAG